MRNPFRFFVELLQQPPWIPSWVFFLMIINVASIEYWHEPLARGIFATFMFSALLMMALYSKFGFEKILGLGHIFWLPLLPVILTKIPATDGNFKSYLIVLSISITVSLLFDIIDVWKYFSARKK